MRNAVLFALALALAPAPALAQFRPSTPPPYPDRLDIRPVVSVGTTWFTAGDTFDAVLGSDRGQDWGGGVNITQGPAFLELSGRRFSKSGSRVFVTDTKEVFPLGIPIDVSTTALEAAIGWRFRPLFGRLRPYAGAGYTRLQYEEAADFATDGDDVKESFNGFHVLGGVEVRVTRWVGVAGDVVWTSVADAIGDAGASRAFGENNLGGTSLRLKLVIGR
jgi:opacity protein-like surface antigen